MRSARIRHCLLVTAVAMAVAPVAPTQAPPGAESRSSSAPLQPTAVSQRGGAIRLNNVGVAYMGQQRFADAGRMFARALAVNPSSDVARLNRAIALYFSQNYDEARALLLALAKSHPKDARAWYYLGLLYKSQARSQEALASFRRAAEIAPGDADARYFVGDSAAHLQQYQQAIEAFEQALRLNSNHASAEFGIAGSYRRLGDMEQARQHMLRFQQITQNKLGSPMSLAYGDQGALSLAQEVRAPQTQVPAAIAVRFEVVPLPVDKPAHAPAQPGAQLGPAACWLDYDGDGTPDLFLSAGSRAGGGIALLRNAGGKFNDVTADVGLAAGATDAQSRPGIACAAADYDNDGSVDLAVSFLHRVSLFHNQGNGKFIEVSGKAGVKAGSSGATALTWLDYDHDGDLDLFAAGENRLWRNNGNGTFAEVSGDTAIGAAPSFAAAGTDFNNDRAVDIVLSGASSLWLNPREGKWSSAPAGSLPDFPTSQVAVADLNKDGWMDLVFTGPADAPLSLWRNANGSFERAAGLNVAWKSGQAVAILDYDNDSWLDVIAAGQNASGQPELRLLRNEGPTGFRDVTARAVLDKLPLQSPFMLAPADFDGDGDTDIAVTQVDGPAFLLRNSGGNRNRALRLSLSGLNDNKSAVGTKVEVFARELYQKWEIANGGSPGQSAVDLLVGLGKETQADVVRLRWPTGVAQDEIELAAGAARPIVELDRRGSSCPVLFAWDGSRYRFITDVLGAGVLGHWVAPGTRNVPDPTEYVKIEGFSPSPRNGLLSFQLMEPMEEVVYLDQVRLLAVDHPADTEVFPNEYFASNPPFPEFKVIASRGARPARVWDGNGEDVTETLRSRDHRYVDKLERLRFQGFVRPHTLEVDLGEPYTGGPLRLLWYGHIEYFTATSMYAADQAGLQPLAPYVEALNADGQWVRVLDDMGFPAGLPRTITVDLTGKLPPGGRRLRVTTNLQIYWDQLLVDRTPEGEPVRVSEAALTRAQLSFHGYPRTIEGATPGDLSYVYEQVSDSGPYARQLGAYTRLGDVRQLLDASDDRFAIFGSGEGVTLEFDSASLPPLPSGWKRDYFFYADGYEKDMDFYAAEPLTVEPLPFRGMGVYPPTLPYPDTDTSLGHRLDNNSRFVGSQDLSAYRFRYGKTRRQFQGESLKPETARPRAR